VYPDVTDAADVPCSSVAKDTAAPEPELTLPPGSNAALAAVPPDATESAPPDITTTPCAVPPLATMSASPPEMRRPLTLLPSAIKTPPLERVIRELDMSVSFLCKGTSGKKHKGARVWGLVGSKTQNTRPRAGSGAMTSKVSQTDEQARAPCRRD
jgi:hypothetical protein